MKFLKSFILISTCLLLSSCYFFDNADDNYIQVKEVVNNVETSNTFYLFENYDSMKEIIVNLVNENFKKWHWNQNKFEEKYDKYKGNITLHQKSIDKMKKYSGYQYCIYKGSSEEVVFSSDSKPYRFNGTVLIITDGSKSTAFYTNAPSPVNN